MLRKNNRIAAMKTTLSYTLLALLATLFLHSGVAIAAKQTSGSYVAQDVTRHQALSNELAQNLWDWAETRFHEKKSSHAMQVILAEQGFKVDVGVADMPTAFVASYGSKDGPVIAILAEMDALPGLSQQAQPYKQSIDGKEAGHACGHHLFGAGSLAAALTVKNWLQQNNIQGQIRLYGTPAEEGGSGKVYMVREGLFSDVDTVLHWHPGGQNTTQPMSTLANKTAKFRFHGIASHAAAAPEQGRSALDAVEAMNYMVNMMREHVPADTRIHYIITHGGDAPNIVPEFAEVYYYLRTPSAADLPALWSRLEKTAQAAAMGTETQVDWEIMSGVWSTLPNATLAKVAHDAMDTFGGIKYSPQEQAFADVLRTTLSKRAVKQIGNEQNIMPYTDDIYHSTASTDVGDISWNVPTAGFVTATWVPGTAPHSWQAVAAGGMSIGYKGMHLASKTLALSAIRLFEQPDLIQQAKTEWRGRVGDVQYQSQIGDRSPIL
ncbi:aminobenzoyl-glutamate utilization protein B [Paraglaciecola polaris LMG 21857]|uniref:Aminobenzoyl-glutamate utilization protein B n=2 Tax=Paraglaciecola polaris TaxID=222814 RepID=K6ZMK0_9ALTE|nr:aminobenzoyl-glutamate utilization protein B [Paraglaciecola polaris LMG 21857]|tara:strand:+ start:22117 stop:23592 length:1476 start_codon:yes stop_codon:yes gene_type:complete